MTRQEEIVLARLMNMSTNLEGFSRATLKALQKQYKAAASNLLAQVKAARGKSTRIWTNTRLIALLEEAQLQHTAITSQITGMTAQATADAGVYAFDQINNITSWDGRVNDFNNIALSKPQMVQLVTAQKLGGRKLGEWIGDALKPQGITIVAELKKGVIQGQGYAKIVRGLASKLVLDSKMKRDMETIVKTYVHSMMAQAQEDVFNANSDLVEKVEWSAIMENGDVKTGRGTCPRCMALDGQQWPLSQKARPRPLLHARCRCLLYPVTKTWRELGFDVDEMEKAYQPWTVRNLKRKDRKILDYGSTDQNYSQWWATRGKSFQNNAIGPTRAGMVRDGTIDFQDIIDSKGNLIPLKSLPGWKPKKKPPKPKPKKKQKPAVKKTIPKKKAPAGVATLGIPSIPYTKATSLDGVLTRMRFDLPSTVELDGLKQTGKDSILAGLNQSVVKYDGKLNSIGWIPRRRKSLAVAARSGEYIRFQKTSTKKMAKGDRLGIHYSANRDYNIEKRKKDIADPRRVNVKSQNEEVLKRLEAATRWGIYMEADDQLMAIAIHEGFHNVMFKHNLESAWTRALTRNNVTIYDKFKVSEYGASKSVELFAEVGTAVELGISIPENVHRAFMQVMNAALGFEKKGF